MNLQSHSIFMAPIARFIALIAKSMVWPNFFLMNVLFALKGSKLFIIISYHCSWMLCLEAALKGLPTLIYSADYILLLVH